MCAEFSGASGAPLLAVGERPKLPSSHCCGGPPPFYSLAPGPNFGGHLKSREALEAFPPRKGRLTHRHQADQVTVPSPIQSPAKPPSDPQRSAHQQCRKLGISPKTNLPAGQLSSTSGATKPSPPNSPPVTFHPITLEPISASPCQTRSPTKSKSPHS